MSISDTPRMETVANCPPPIADQIKIFIGDLARPFVLVSLGTACSVGLLLKSTPSDKLGLALTALGAIYAAKSWEKHGEAKANATVAVAQATAGTTP